MACSLPPDPMTRSFMVNGHPCAGRDPGTEAARNAPLGPLDSCLCRNDLVSKMPHPREHQGDAMLVGGGDAFLVAGTAAGLDHRPCASLGDDIEADAGAEGRVG